jgi:SAM-dependent methyltransferase
VSLTIQQLFKQGMDRDIPELRYIPDAVVPVGGWLAFDLGASGEKVMEDCEGLGLPDWEFPRDAIPSDDNTVDVIHAYHFLEHLSGEDAIKLLREVERVLIPGGIMNICVPYYSSSMQAQDLTHKSQWCETTFQTLFENAYYDPAGKWRLRVHTQFIMGIVERNLALFVQLVKGE